MTVENISWSISMKKCCQTRRGSNLWPVTSWSPKPVELCWSLCHTYVLKCENKHQQNESCHPCLEIKQSEKWNYCIRPNYRTMRLGFSKLLGKLVVKYVSTYTMGTLIQRSAKDLSNYAYVMFLCFLFLIFFIKAYVVGNHLHCINMYPQHMLL